MNEINEMKKLMDAMNEANKVHDIQTLNVEMKDNQHFEIQGSASADGILKMLCATIQSIEDNYDIPVVESLMFITMNLTDIGKELSDIMKIMESDC